MVNMVRSSNRAVRVLRCLESSNPWDSSSLPTFCSTTGTVWFDFFLAPCPDFFDFFSDFPFEVSSDWGMRSFEDEEDVTAESVSVSLLAILEQLRTKFFRARVWFQSYDHFWPAFKGQQINRVEGKKDASFQNFNILTLSYKNGTSAKANWQFFLSWMSSL